MTLTTTELERFVTMLAASPERWQHLVRHADDARVYELIWRDLLEDLGRAVAAG